MNRRWALWLGTTELAGVLTVGLASELIPAAFPDATVWSGFGSGYGYVPAILPVLAICWARFPARKNHATSSSASEMEPPRQ